MNESRADLARGVLIAKVVSGGETGADRAAVDFAIAHDLSYGGWVPLNGWAEDLREPPGLLALYDKFVPTQSADPGVRTTLNVRDIPYLDLPNCRAWWVTSISVTLAPCQLA